MTTLREAAQQALEVLDAPSGTVSIDQWVDMCSALRAALADPTCKDHLHVEPVAWLIKWVNANDGVPQGEWQRGYDAARNVVRAHLKAAQQVVNQQMTTEPVAKVEVMTTGGNAGLATRIVEIDDHLRERAAIRARSNNGN